MQGGVLYGVPTGSRGKVIPTVAAHLENFLMPRNEPEAPGGPGEARGR